MVYVIGEILADMIGTGEDGGLSFKAFCGGAPFNVAVNAKLAGAKVGFLGRIGNDTIGRFLEKESKKANLDILDLQKDDVRNTTLAFVTLVNGERDFAFNRHDTADYNIDTKNLKFTEDTNIVHLGSLMLSEKVGIKIAKSVLAKAKKQNKLVSFDVNFRTDIYKSKEDAVKTYLPFIKQSNIVKFSDDELEMITGVKGVEEGVKAIYEEGQLIVVTLGSKGSFYYNGKESGIIPTEPIKPIDTTGAGDSFFGTFLANIEGKEFSKENIEKAMELGNKAGAMTTQFLGAIKL